MLFTKDKNLSGFLGNLISNIFIDLKSHGLIEALRSAVIAAAEGALEPALLDDVLIIIFIISFCMQSLHAVELQQYRIMGSRLARLKRYLQRLHLSLDSMLGCEIN